MHRCTHFSAVASSRLRYYNLAVWVLSTILHLIISRFWQFHFLHRDILYQHTKFQHTAQSAFELFWFNSYQFGHFVPSWLWPEIVFNHLLTSVDPYIPACQNSAKLVNAYHIFMHITWGYTFFCMKNGRPAGYTMEHSIQITFTWFIHHVSSLWTYTVFQKKTSTHIIGYKLRNSCLILIIFDIKIPHIIWHRKTA